MRILYLYQYFTTPKGSWGTRAYEFARRWVKAGDSVTVVTSVYDKSDLKPMGLISEFHIDGIRVIVINIRLSNKHSFYTRICGFFAYSVIACAYAASLGADVVVASSGPLTIGLPGLVARYLRRRPLVFEVRDLWPEGAVQLGILRNRLLIRLARLLEERCYRASCRVVALSEGMASWIRRTYRLRHLEVVPNACDNDLFGRDGLAAEDFDEFRGKKLVLYTGTIGLMDDCLQIVRMAEQLQAMEEESVRVVLIGDGKERLQLEQYAREHELRNIRFLGSMPKDRVAAWLRHARCALLTFRAVPLLDTSSPNKMFDAFAAGVPLIQVTQGWIKDLLERERCGITVPPNDPRAMAKAVQCLVHDEALRTEMAANARRVAQELFDRDLLAGRMREILLSAAECR